MQQRVYPIIASEFEFKNSTYSSTLGKVLKINPGQKATVSKNFAFKRSIGVNNANDSNNSNEMIREICLIYQIVKGEMEKPEINLSKYVFSDKVTKKENIEIQHGNFNTSKIGEISRVSSIVVSPVNEEDAGLSVMYVLQIHFEAREKCNVELIGADIICDIINENVSAGMIIDSDITVKPEHSGVELQVDLTSNDVCVCLPQTETNGQTTTVKIVKPSHKHRLVIKPESGAAINGLNMAALNKGDSITLAPGDQKFGDYITFINTENIYNISSAAGIWTVNI